MKALYPTLALAALAFAACDDDSYDNWADAQANPDTTKEEQTATSFSVAPVSAINFADLADDVDSIAIFTPTLTFTGQEADAITYKVILGNSTEEVLTNNGVVATADLKSAIETEFGKSPTQRELAAVVVAYPSFGSVVSRETANVTITATLKAPVIEDAYYFVGTANNWTITDVTYKFTRADESVDKYDDPVFTVTIPASVDATTGERVDEWFKIATPAAVAGEGDWNAVIGGTVDGATPLEATALVTTDAQAFKMPKEDGALYYTITLNMMDYTIVVTPVSYTSWVYAPGDGNGWAPAAAPALYSADADGIYTGYVYVGSQFKFTKERNWDNGEYNYSSFTSYPDGFSGEGTGNIQCATAGVYFMTADVASKKLSVTLISRMGIVGPAQAGGWDADTEMTWNADEHAYTWTGDLAADQLKFRANNGWDINLGGDISNLTAGGDNITVSEAGNYTVKLFPCRTTSEKMYCTFTKN